MVTQAELEQLLELGHELRHLEVKGLFALERGVAVLR